MRLFRLRKIDRWVFRDGFGSHGRHAFLRTNNEKLRGKAVAARTWRIGKHHLRCTSAPPNSGGLATMRRLSTPSAIIDCPEPAVKAALVAPRWWYMYQMAASRASMITANFGRWLVPRARENPMANLLALLIGTAATLYAIYWLMRNDTVTRQADQTGWLRLRAPRASAETGIQRPRYRRAKRHRGPNARGRRPT